MPQKYDVAIDPTLDINLDELVAAWQANEEAMEVGRIRENFTVQGAFADPATALLITTAVSIPTSIISGVLTAVIIDYIKEKHYKKKPKLMTIKKPDGTPMFVVEMED